MVKRIYRKVIRISSQNVSQLNSGENMSVVLDPWFLADRYIRCVPQVLLETLRTHVMVILGFSKREKIENKEI